MLGTGVLVVGLGSPHGDDRAGWLLVERLRASQPSAVDAVALKTPLDLLDHLPGCRKLICVDGCVSSSPAGTITRRQWPNQALAESGSRSTHGVGLIEALRLADALDKLPAIVVIFTIEIEASGSADDISPSVRDALVALERQVLAECQHE